MRTLLLLSVKMFEKGILSNALDKKETVGTEGVDSRIP
jgi:hypothetical protein